MFYVVSDTDIPILEVLKHVNVYSNYWNTDLSRYLSKNEWYRDDSILTLEAANILKHFIFPESKA